MSLPEVLLWNHLRPSACKDHRIRRQHPVAPGFVVDFYCAQLRVAIELDGDAFHEDLDAVRDAERQAKVEAAGIRFLRVPAQTVLEDPAGAAERILELLSSLARDS
jgi:very-short-patch-repair endonuclease